MTKKKGLLGSTFTIGAWIGDLRILGGVFQLVTLTGVLTGRYLDVLLHTIRRALDAPHPI
jgi:hypothetical protein